MAQKMISGYATQNDTKPTSNTLFQSIFFSRRRELYKNGPYCSLIGFGAYRIGYKDYLSYPQCEESLRHAIQEGVNIIDTSSTYSNGQSETLIGSTVKKLIHNKSIKRQDIILMSKAGYVQEGSLELATRKELNNKPFKNMYRMSNEFWYCIHPDFLKDQVERSLKRLNVDTLDVFFIHNPEVILKYYELNGVDRNTAKEKFLDSLKRAFLSLEGLAENNIIKAYGVSSNTLGSTTEDFTSISLVEIQNIIKTSGLKHFKLIQVPFNWLEISPGYCDIDNSRETTFSFANKNNIGVITNRPLNSMLDNNLIRLTQPTSIYFNKDLSQKEKQGYDNWLKLSNDLKKIFLKETENIPGYKDAPLSQIVLSSLAWFPGISCTLCGMRREEYVEDCKNALKRPPILEAKNHILNIYNNLEFHS